MTLRRSVAGVLATGAVLTGTAGVIGAGVALTAGPASAGPAEDCAAVRARDHQIYLNLIASLLPGAPLPPECINPCLTAPSMTGTAAATTTVGLPGAQAPGGGPNVAANAPTNFLTYNGTPIVPVPTIEVSVQRIPEASMHPTVQQCSPGGRAASRGGNRNGLCPITSGRPSCGIGQQVRSTPIWTAQRLKNSNIVCVQANLWIAVQR